MKKNKWIVTIVMFLCICSLCTIKTEAKSYRYQASMLPKKICNSYQMKQSGAVYKAKMASNKITLWGRLMRYEGRKGTKHKLYKSAKRTFRLANTVKFYSSGGDGKPLKLKRNTFKYLMTRYNGLSLLMYTKNGKVTKMYMCS